MQFIEVELVYFYLGGWGWNICRLNFFSISPPYFSPCFLDVFFLLRVDVSTVDLFVFDFRFYVLFLFLFGFHQGVCLG